MFPDRLIPIIFVFCATLGCSRDTTKSQLATSSAPIVDSGTSSNSVAPDTSQAKPSGQKLKDLIIVDTAGKPVPNASIQGIAASMGGPRSYSNVDGKANIPFAIQPIQWVTVSKTGYKTAEMIDIGQTHPIRITLELGEGVVRPPSLMGSGDSSLDSGQK